MRYQAALRKHIEQGTGINLRLVQSIGRQAVALGLETLDLAKTHKKAMASLILPNDTSKKRESTIRRARLFFAEAAVRIEKTHRAALEADTLIRQLNRLLRQRTRESSAVNNRLKQTILKRRKAEASMKKSGKNHARLLTESNRLLKNLRRLTHTFLAAQEAERKDSGNYLHDEIAQGLLGIHVQLLALKKAIHASTASLKKEIGNTQRLVRESKRRVHRFAYECGIKSQT